MEEIVEGVNNINISDFHKKNRIQVSNTKKPVFFYVKLAKVLKPPFWLQQGGTSPLGGAASSFSVRARARAQALGLSSVVCELWVID